MAFTTLIQTGEQATADMFKRILGQQYYNLAATAGVGTGFAAGAVGITNGAAGADPNHFSVQADGTDLVLTIRGGWAFVVQDVGTSSFDPRTYMVESSGPITYTVPSNSQGSTRVDTICLRIDQSISPDSTGSNLPTIYNVQGGASSALGNAPSDGALYYPLALVTIDNGETSLTSADVADKRQSAGGTAPSTRPIQYLTSCGAMFPSATVPPPATTNLLFQGGTFVFTTDSGGNFTVTFTSPFPNGLLYFHAENGDPVTSVNIVMTSNIATATKSSISVRSWDVHNNVALPISNIVRANWFAIGW